jgi:uncharacterized protein
MIINVRSLPLGRSVITQNVVMTDEQAANGNIRGQVSCRAVIDALQWKILARVAYSAAVDCTCARCLKVFEQSVPGEYDIVLFNSAAPREEIPDGETGDSFLYSQEDCDVDTRQALYDDIMTALPLMPLCSADCRGIAVDAGATAAQDSTDPRWDALRRLKGRS